MLTFLITLILVGREEFGIFLMGLGIGSFGFWLFLSGILGKKFFQEKGSFKQDVDYFL